MCVCVCVCVWINTAWLFQMYVPSFQRGLLLGLMNCSCPLYLEGSFSFSHPIWFPSSPLYLSTLPSHALSLLLTFFLSLSPIYSFSIHRFLHTRLLLLSLCDAMGNLKAPVLKSFRNMGAPSLEVIGWFKYRSLSSLLPSFRDRAFHNSFSQHVKSECSLLACGARNKSQRKDIADLCHQ